MPRNSSLPPYAPKLKTSGGLASQVSQLFDVQVAVHGAGWLAAFAGNDNHAAGRAAGTGGSS